MGVTQQQKPLNRVADYDFNVFFEPRLNPYAFTASEGACRLIRRVPLRDDRIEERERFKVLQGHVLRPDDPEYPGRAGWTVPYRRWLADLSFSSAPQHIALQEYRDASRRFDPPSLASRHAGAPVGYSSGLARYVATTAVLAVVN